MLRATFGVELSQIACGACARTSFSCGTVTPKYTSSRLPVIRVAHYLDGFVRPELGKLEWAGADRMQPHLLRRDVARIDRRPPGRQHRQERRLRPVQMEGDLVIAFGCHLRHIAQPRFARVD